MKITVVDFVNDFKTKKIQNTKINDHAISDYLRDTLEIQTYLPFREKRIIAETVVAQNIELVDGIKKYDNINSYLSFIIATIAAYTSLKFSEDPIADYDLLAESGLLPLIIEEFKAEYNEIDVLLKMAIAAELEDNNVNVLVGNFLNSILEKLDGAGEVIKSVAEKININEILGESFKGEDLAKLNDLLHKLK